MALVKINSGAIEATDKLDDVPRDKWRELMLARRLHMKTKLGYDCSCLVEFVDDAKKMFSTLGFSNVEQMIRDGYNLVPEEIDIAVQWLRLNPPRHPISLDAAIQLGNKGGWSDNVRPSGARSTGYGNARAYLLARLDRDSFTELAAKVRAGEMSANAAAIKAGFRKKTMKRCPKCGHEW